jgi:DNA replication protein DnaC
MKKTYLKINYLANEFKNIGVKIKPQFNPDTITEVLVKFFCSEREIYFPSLKTEPMKGLILMGFVGVGKTLNFAIYRSIQAKVDGIGFRIISSKEIETQFKQEGEIFIQSLIDADELMIDDLGSESKSIKDFGNDRNLVSDILIQRYVRFQRHECITHATTNLNVELLTQHYDARLIDRMKEMFVLKKINTETKSKRV